MGVVYATRARGLGNAHADIIYSSSAARYIGTRCFFYRFRCFGIEVIWRHVAIENWLALVAASAARELVPDGSVYGIVEHVQSCHGDEAARRLQQLLGKLQRHLFLLSAHGLRVWRYPHHASEHGPDIRARARACAW